MREQLVAALSRDYGVHPYGKWRGAFWRLASLVDLGVEPGHPGAPVLCTRAPLWMSVEKAPAEAV